MTNTALLLQLTKMVVSDLAIFELCKYAVMLYMSSSSKQQRESHVFSYR